MLSEVCRSGSVKCPAENCAIQFFVGKTEILPAYESIGPQSMFHRFSSGSVP